MLCNQETKEKNIMEIKINPPISNSGNLSSGENLLFKNSIQPDFDLLFINEHERMNNHSFGRQDLKTLLPESIALVFRHQ
jgi:hypothetical protein